MDPLLDLAKKEVRISEHILSITMDMLNDKKLLLSATNHIEKAIDYIMDYYVKKSKKYLPSNKELKKRMFIENFAENQQIIEIMKKVDNIKETKKREQISFIRGRDVVILTNNYNTKVIKEEDIKEILKELKNFLSVVE